MSVRCQNLTKKFGDLTAVKGLDLEVRVGECFGLLGPNGAGKTTTIEILEGLTEPDAGTVEVLGLNWRDHRAQLRERLGISLQETKLADKLTVRETVTLFRSLYKKGPEADEIIALVQLQEKEKAWVSKLSGGQRQRLAIACALAGSPDMLFLDEPTTGLDPQSRRSLWELIEGFRATGRTILLTTHYMEEAQRLCDRVGIMDHGRIIALGTPQQLIASLEAEHVITFSIANEMQAPPVETLRALPGVRDARVLDGHTSLTVREMHTSLPALLTLLQSLDLPLADLTTHHASLEDVFVAHTGRQLRDE